MGINVPIIRDALGPLNRAHGLSGGLQSVLKFDAAGAAVDIVNPKRGITVFNYAWDAVGAGGPSIKASVNTGYLKFLPSVPVVNSSWTVSGMTRFPIDSNAFACFACSRTANVFHVLRNNATDALCCFNGTATNFSPTIAPLTLSGWKRLTVVGNAAGARAYLDGTFAGSHATPINVPVEDLLGDHSGNNTARTWGAIKDFFVWNRSLSPAEVMDHAADPFAMFGLDDVFIADLLAAGGNVPLNVTLGQASWTWTGVAPRTDFKLGVTLGQASWGWTGFAALTNFKLGVTLGQSLWSWAGRPLSGLGGAVAAILGLFPVRGSKENLRPGSKRGGTDAT